MLLAYVQASGVATPACRHAVRTISSPDVSSVWRVVSEDSNQLGCGFLAVHIGTGFPRGYRGAD